MTYANQSAAPRIPRCLRQGRRRPRLHPVQPLSWTPLHLRAEDLEALIIYRYTFLFAYTITRDHLDVSTAVSRRRARRTAREKERHVHICIHTISPPMPSSTCRFFSCTSILDFELTKTNRTIHHRSRWKIFCHLKPTALPRLIHRKHTVRVRYSIKCIHSYARF